MKPCKKYLQRNIGKSIDEAKEMTDNVEVQAKTVGLDYDYGKMTPANTFNAHRLAKLAEQQGVGAGNVGTAIKGLFY